MNRLLGCALLTICIVSAVFAEIDIYSSADEKTKAVLANADKLIAEQKYESAFNSLGPENDNEYIIAKKIDLCLDHSVQTIMHAMFAFKDLDQNESADEESVIQTNYACLPFDPVQIVQEYTEKKGSSAILDKALGDYYYDIYAIYSERWAKSDEEVLKESQKYYLSALEKNCLPALAIAKCGDVSLYLGENEKAIELYSKALSLDSSLDNAHYQMAMAYLDSGQYDLAVKEGEIACKLFESNLDKKMDALLLCADASYESKMFDNALKYLLTALEEVKDDYRIYKKLIRCYLTQNDIEKAEEYTDALLALAPRNPASVQIVMENYEVTNRNQHLSGFFTRNIKKYSDDCQVLGTLYFYYAIHSLQLDKKIEAAEFAQLSKDNFIKADRLSDEISEALANIMEDCK